MASEMESYYEYHVWGFQKCKNYQNIPTGSGSIGLQSEAFKVFSKAMLIGHVYSNSKAIWPTSGWNILIIFAFLESLCMI